MAAQERRPRPSPYQSISAWLQTHGAAGLPLEAWREIVLETYDASTQPIDVDTILATLKRLSGVAPIDITPTWLETQNIAADTTRAARAAMEIARRVSGGIPKIDPHRTKGVFSKRLFG
jgi:hypothetical protein